MEHNNWRARVPPASATPTSSPYFAKDFHTPSKARESNRIPLALFSSRLTSVTPVKSPYFAKDRHTPGGARESNRILATPFEPNVVPTIPVKESGLNELRLVDFKPEDAQAVFPPSSCVFVAK